MEVFSRKDRWPWWLKAMMVLVWVLVVLVMMFVAEVTMVALSNLW